MMLQVGQVVRFDYTSTNKKTGKPEKKVRQVRIEGIWPDLMRGFDYLADAPVGGYRSFAISKMENVTN